MQCPNPMKIHIVSSTLGTSAPECVDNTRCCPSNNTCTVEATSKNLQNLTLTCDGKQTCRVAVHRQRCPVGTTTYTDFESVTYTCDTSQGEVTTQIHLISLSLVFTAPTTSTNYHTTPYNGVSMNLYFYLHTYKYMSVCMHVCLHMCMHVCACVHVCMCACVHVCICVYVHTYVNACMCVGLHAYIIHKCTCEYVHSM